MRDDAIDQIEMALEKVIFNTSYLNWIPEDNKEAFDLLFTPEEFDRARWGFPYVSYLIADYFLSLENRERGRDALLALFAGHPKFTCDNQQVVIGRFILLRPEIEAIQDSGHISRNPFRYAPKQKIKMDVLRAIILEPRVKFLNEFYEQGRRPSASFFSPSTPGWEGLDLLASAYAIGFSGPDMLPRLRASDAIAIRKVELIQRVLEAAADDLGYVFRDSSYDEQEGEE